MPVGALKVIVQRRYGWALDIDFEAPANLARFWYVSEEKLEPRLGERFEEPGAEREQPLDIARQASALWHSLGGEPDDTPVARFLASHPEHRTFVRRVHISADMPYAEIRDNLISENLLPIDLLRCKLAFFGATRFDPRSDRWLRISLFQGAPYPDELCREATQ
jgi:hypothetical protein